MTTDFDITRRGLLVWAGAMAAGLSASGCQTSGPPAPASDEAAALLADLERRSFDYFWDTTNPANGLVPDRWPTPSFASIAGLVRDRTRSPLVDVRRLIEWQIFNVVTGNADGHAKNLSLLYDEAGPARLAPFYDLLSKRDALHDRPPTVAST